MEVYEHPRELVLLLLKTRMSFRQAVQRIIKRNNIDMTFEMLQIISSLWDKQGISQQFLAEKTAKDKACMTNLIGNLEKKGWIVRKLDPNDRRNRLVYLTPEGIKISDKVRPLVYDIYTQTGAIMGIDEINESILKLKRLHDIFGQL